MTGADRPSPGQATEFFDRLYDAAARDPGVVPWASEAPNRWLVEWLPGRGEGTALVVGCGLGDDAEELARRGWDVTAFDASPTAVAWARERFPASPVRYVVADLFDLPGGWRRSFDLVVEVRTVQSLPTYLRDTVVAAIAGTVAPGGALFLVANSRPEGTVPSGPPWPVAPSELQGLAAAGLVGEEWWEPAGHVVAVYRRPGG